MQPVAQDLIGRSAEQAALADFLDSPYEGTRALLLEGEAGIGKTSLWRAAVSIAGTRGCRVMSSAPTEAESGLPYAVLGDLFHSVPKEVIASLSAPLRMAL